MLWFPNKSVSQRTGVPLLFSDGVGDFLRPEYRRHIATNKAKQALIGKVDPRVTRAGDGAAGDRAAIIARKITQQRNAALQEAAGLAIAVCAGRQHRCPVSSTGQAPP
ncbi:hypothetical protein TU87_22305 [Pseudomonas weihenstephanensis]|nr:hypothetical protein TU87_22305 [Pseudomonas weihenstephanensis]